MNSTKIFQVVPGSKYYCFVVNFELTTEERPKPVMFNFHEDDPTLTNLGGINLKYLIEEYKRIRALKGD